MYEEWGITLDEPIKIFQCLYPSVICLLTRSFFPKGEKYKFNKIYCKALKYKLYNKIFTCVKLLFLYISGFPLVG